MRPIILAIAACLLAPAASSATYDPMEIPAAEIRTITMDVTDASRQQTIPIRAYLPPNPSAAPLILFSHGLGGSRDNNPYLGKHWAARGFLVVFVQHPGSDETVWKNAGPGRLQALRDAASPKNYVSRTKDIPAVLDQLEKWNRQPGHPLHGRFDPDHIGMSGHSFGAQTTQAMAGQQASRLGIDVREKRIDAALILSPSPPSRGDAEAAFSPIRIPCLLMTGTRDDNPITHADPSTRLKVFPHLRAAPAWQVVFDGALHSDFGQRSTARSGLTRYHQAILALSTAFWDATLKGDGAAAAWLTGKPARHALEKKDVWQMNDRARAWTP